MLMPVPITPEVIVVRELATDREVWTRQPDEPDREWTVFANYRDMGPGVRALSHAYNKYMNDRRAVTDPEIPPAKFRDAATWAYNAAKEWSWRERVAAYDAHVDEQLLADMRSQRVRVLSETAALGTNMRKKALQALNALHAILYEEVIGSDGQLKTVEKSALSPAAVVQLAKAGVELERYALGMERESSPGTSVTVNVGDSAALPIPGGDETIMTRIIDIARTRAELAAPMPSAKPNAKTGRAGDRPAPGEGR